MGERAVQVALGDLGGVFNPLGGHDELFAGGKGEVVIGVGVACQVDLGGQVLVARGGDKVVDVRRAFAVAAQGLEHHVGGGAFGHAVAGRNDAARGVTTFAVRIDRAAQVVLGLRGVEEGVAAQGVGVPDLDLGAGDRGAVDVTHLAGQPHGLALGRFIVQAREAFRLGGTGHV